MSSHLGVTARTATMPCRHIDESRPETPSSPVPQFPSSLVNELSSGARGRRVAGLPRSGVAYAWQVESEHVGRASQFPSSLVV
jgi:hypothetical protein